MRPRIRTLKPELWADEKIVALSRDARLLFLGLMTMADDEGRFRAHRSTIWGHAFPADEDAFERVNEWLGEIRDQGFVVFYSVEGTPYGAFRNWRKHQAINRPTPSDLPAPPDVKVVRANRVFSRRRTVVVSEDSGSSPESLREESGRTPIPTRRRAFRSDPLVVDVDLNDKGKELTETQRVELLSELLAARIVSNDPNASVAPFGARWLKDMGLVLKDRKGDWQEVRRMIDWSQADGFWRSNILSPAKLRKQFTQLLLKAASPNATAEQEKRERTSRRLASLDRLIDQGKAAQ